METVNFIKDDLSIICKNCGYELGVHASRGGFCPDKNEDPYKQKFSQSIQHIFNEKSTFEKPLKNQEPNNE